MSELDGLAGTVNELPFGRHAPGTLLLTHLVDGKAILIKNRYGWNSIQRGESIYPPKSWPMLGSFSVRDASNDLRKVFEVACNKRRGSNQFNTKTRKGRLNAAQRKLAANHVWIAQYHSKRMAGEVGYWDLLGVAYVALVKAAKKWPGKLSFVPYATTHVIQRLINANRDASRKIRKGIFSTNRHKGFEPDDQCYEEDGSGVYYVRDWLCDLPPDERRAVTLSFGIGCKPRSAARVAIAMRTTQQKAREILKSGLLRLRYMATCEQVNG